MSNDAPFIRPVPQRFPGTALSGTQTQLLGSLSFPAAGGVQAVDALGAVLPLSSATGSLVPAEDNADDLGQITTPLRWKSGFFGTSVMTPTLTVYVAGVEALVLKLSNSGTAVNYFNATNAATGVAPVLSVTGTDADINLGLAAKGTGVIVLTSPETINPTVATSGIPSALRVTGAENTGITATKEAIDIDFDLGRTVTWAAGNVTSQRAVRVKAPTYVVSGGASTITTASTMSLSGAPVAGATTILAQSYSLFVESGVTNLAGGVGLSTGSVAGGDNNAAAVCLTVRRLVDSAASGVAGVGANGVGGALSFEAPNSAGTQTLSGLILSKLTTVTAGAEVAELSLGGAYGGASREALRLVGVAGAVVNRVEVTPSISGSPVLVTATGAASGNTSLTIAGSGTGTISLNAGATGSVSIGVNAASLVGFYAAAPVARAGAITAATVADVGYLQATAQTWVDAINNIRAALTNIGITL